MFTSLSSVLQLITLFVLFDGFVMNTKHEFIHLSAVTTGRCGDYCADAARCSKAVRREGRLGSI